MQELKNTTMNFIGLPDPLFFFIYFSFLSLSLARSLSHFLCDSLTRSFIPYREQYIA